MKIFTLILALLTNTALGAGVLQQWSTTNSGLVVSNYTLAIASNHVTARMAAGITVPSVTVTGAAPGTILLNDANGGLRLQLGTNDNLFLTNASTAWTVRLTNGGAIFSSNVVAANFYGNGANLTGIGLTGIATNNGTGTNNQFTGVVLAGATTNADGMVHTGGWLETNYATKSFMLYTNASIMASNGTVIRAGTFFWTNGPTQSLLYLGTNPPFSGLATAVAQGAIGSTNVFQIDVPNVNNALGVHTNGGVWLATGLTNNGTTKLTGAVLISGALTSSGILNQGSTISGYSYSVLPKTANYTISQNADSGKYLDNVGAGGAITNTLPSAVLGLHYYFYVDAAQILCVQSAGTDTIRSAATVSAAAGNIFSSATGSALHIVCIKTGAWMIDQIVGTWTGPQ